MWIEYPKLFGNNDIIYFKWLNGTCGNTSFTLNRDQNSRILIACDNTYTMESKDEFVFVDFFIHPIPLVICDHSLLSWRHLSVNDYFEMGVSLDNFWGITI